MRWVSNESRARPTWLESIAVPGGGRTLLIAKTSSPDSPGTVPPARKAFKTSSEISCGSNPRRPVLTSSGIAALSLLRKPSFSGVGPPGKVTSLGNEGRGDGGSALLSAPGTGPVSGAFKGAPQVEVGRLGYGHVRLLALLRLLRSVTFYQPSAGLLAVHPKPCLPSLGQA